MSVGGNADGGGGGADTGGNDVVLLSKWAIFCPLWAMGEVNYYCVEAIEYFIWM